MPIGTPRSYPLKGGTDNFSKNGLGSPCDIFSTMFGILENSPNSFEACFQSLSNYSKIYWIVGGLPKHQDNFNLKKVKKRIVKAYLIGKNTSFFKNQIKNNLPFTTSKNLRNAIKNIYRDITLEKKSKITILLSPAAASFDQFSNFEDRGTYFKNLIIKRFKRNQNV